MKAKLVFAAVVITLSLVSCVKITHQLKPITKLNTNDTLDNGVILSFRTNEIPLENSNEQIDLHSTKIIGLEKSYAIITYESIIFYKDNGKIITKRKLYKDLMEETKNTLTGLDTAEFKKIRYGIVAAADNFSNVYILEKLTGVLLKYNYYGDIIAKLKINNSQNANDLYTDKDGRIYVHKAPTEKDLYFVDVYEKGKYSKSILPIDKKYIKYLKDNYINGGFVEMTDGDLFEGNELSTGITRINTDFTFRTETVKDGGISEPDIKAYTLGGTVTTASGKIVLKRDFVSGFYRFNNKNDIFRVFVHIIPEQNKAEKYYQHYKLSVNQLRTGKYNGSFFLRFNTHDLIKLDYEWNAEQKCNIYKIVKYL